MISCVIIEDLQIAADYLARCCEKSGQALVKAHFTNVQPALDWLREHTVDLLFLDVEMPGASGFEVLDNIPYRPKVILTTSKEEYAYNAFQYNVTDFLKKPFTYQRFSEALGKLNPADNNIPAGQADHVFIKSEGKLVRLNNEEILYVESMGDYVRFVTPEKKYISYATIKSIEEKINKQLFMKVHRSYIVNLQKIDDVRENDLYINGIEIPISRANKAEALKRLNII